MVSDNDYYSAFFRSLIGGDSSSILGKRLVYFGESTIVPYEVLITGVQSAMESYEKDKSLEFVNSYKKTDSELILVLQEKGFYEWCLENVEEFKEYEVAITYNNKIKEKDDIKLNIELSGELVSVFAIELDAQGCNDVAFKLDFTKTNDMEGKELAHIFDKSVEETVVGDWKYSLTKFLEDKQKNNVDTVEFKYGFDVNDSNSVIEYINDNLSIVSKTIYIFDDYSYNLEFIEIATDEEFNNAYTVEELIELIKNY